MPVATPRPNYNDPKYKISAQEQTLQQRGGQGAAALQQAQAGQRDALAQMAGAAAGEAPSVAQQQQQAGMEQAMAQQMAMQAQGRGGNLGQMTAAAGAQGAAMQQQAVQQAAQLRAQEMEAARAQYGQMAGQMAGQAQQQMMGYDQMGLGFLEGQLGRSQQQQQFDAQMAFQQQQANRDLAMGIAEMGVGAAGAAASGGMLSDERAKTAVKDASDEIRDALDQLAPVSWVYKDESNGKGRKTGVMAQALERSAAGSRVVSETPRGKMLDVGGVAALSLAGLADVHKRLKSLEHA